MSWVFDRQVAEVFPTHARAHIPNYDQVIEQTVDVCRLYDPAASIIDVGVATGETISKLHQAGFHNLSGVDNSQDMLDKCPQNIAKLIKSDTLPDEPYDVVIMNWTLHFIQNKVGYLERAYRQLNEGGALILSEKTSMEDLPKRFYYDFKRKNGVTESGIQNKETALKSVMFVNDVSWYLDRLGKVGFKKIYIPNAFWAFTTFVCIKD